jgi:hypothetical protein
MKRERDTHGLSTLFSPSTSAAALTAFLINLFWRMDTQYVSTPEDVDGEALYGN